MNNSKIESQVESRQHHGLLIDVIYCFLTSFKKQVVDAIKKLKIESQIESKQHHGLKCEALEPRVLLSAGAEALLVDSTLLQSDPNSQNQTEAVLLLKNNLTHSNQTSEEISDARTELVIIDSNTPDYQSLLADLENQNTNQLDILILDANEDGIEQINNFLSQYNNIDALHFISHGSDGNVNLGNSSLNFNSLSDYSDDLQNWQNRLSAEADILIYGCDVASTEDGQDFIDILSVLTGADVAASDDLTGNSAKGGDWDLEYKAGQIETDLAFTEQLQQNYEGVLVAPVISARETVDNDSDGQIDHIKITTDINLDDDFSGLNVTVAGYTVTGYATSLSAGGENDNVFYIQLTESGTPDTGDTPTVTVTTNTTLSEFGGSNNIATDIAWGDSDSGMVTFDSVTGNDIGYGTVVDSAGNSYVAGYINNGANRDLVVRKYDANGDLDLTWGDSNSGMVTYDGGGTDEGYDITIDASNNIYVTGTSSNDFIVRKYDANGVLDATWGNSGMVTYDGGFGADSAGDITVDTSGNIYVAGKSNNGTNDDFIVRKYDANGVLDTTWGDGGNSGMVTYNGGNDDATRGITLDASGNIYVAGYSTNGTNRDFIVRKYDANGDLDLTWGDSNSGMVTYDGGNGADMARAITLDASNNIYVSGHSRNSTNDDLIVRKYDANGDLDLTWGDSNSGMVTYDGGNGDVSRDIIIDASNNIYVAGDSHNGTNQDFIVRKYDANGDLDLTWGDSDSGMVTYDSGTGHDYARSISIDAFNNIYVSGDGHNGTNQDLILRVYDANGDLGISRGVAATDKAGPVILSTETADLDGDGFIDAVHVTYSEAIDDTSVIANDWDVAGVTGEAFSSTTNGDTANDTVIYINFTDGVLGTNATPIFNYTQDSPIDADVTDMVGNLAANVVAGATIDGVANYVPVATGNTVVTDEDVPLVIGAGDFNFTDAEGNALTSVTINGLTLNGGTLTHTGGTVTVTNGMAVTAAQLADLTFTSALNDSTNSSFTYTVNDSGNGVTSATMNITVNAVNDAPTGNVTISGTVTEDQTLTANNTLVDLDGLGAFNYQWQRDGVDIAGATGSTYTLGDTDVGAVMTVTISYLDSYSTVESVTSAPTAAVTNLNDAPVATAENISTNEDTAIVINTATDLLANDTDIDGDTLSIASFSQPANGSMQDNGDGTYTYAPTLNFNGTDSFTYTVTDGNGGSDSVTVNVTVNSINDLPLATDQSFNLVAINNGQIVGSYTATDPDTGDTLTYSIIGGPDNAGFNLDSTTGEISITDSSLINTSLPSLSFIVQSDDGNGGISSAQVTIALVLPEETDPVPVEPVAEVIVETPVVEAPVVEVVTPVEAIGEVLDTSTEEEPLAPSDTATIINNEEVSNENEKPANEVEEVAQPDVEPTVQETKINLVPSLTLVNNNLLAGDERTTYAQNNSSLGNLELQSDKLKVDVRTERTISKIRQDLNESFAEGVKQEKLIIASIQGTGLSLTVGFAAYALRTGALLTSMMSSVPMWYSFDPLPLLASEDKDEDDYDGLDQVENLFK